uniref:Uncharacterized protein n=1 Tax=Brassica oleracea var. oleracea TaxID=109376 RepID=A0A0D3B968_BRAOL
MAQTVSPLTAIVTLMWLDLKTAAANSLPTKAGNLANAKCVRLDISFKTPSLTGLQTTQLGNVFDPRQMRGSVQGSGIYRNRERGHSLSVVGRLKHRLGQQPNQPSKKMHWLKRKSPINVSRLGSFGRMVESRL